MIATEFGIILELDEKHVYTEYEPEKYGCVAIDDDLYIDDWWDELKKMHTYFGGEGQARERIVSGWHYINSSRRA